MNYLIVTSSHEPFYTNWFDAENNFRPDYDMVVFNLLTCKYTTDGKNWHEIKQDHL